ncbi:MAG: tRNA pseudouridine(13) synthase TruD, partial [Planctomycetota bacterium]
DRRLEDGTLLRLLEGDLAWKHDSRSVFAVTAEEVEGAAGATLAERARSLQVSPSGPMWGWGMTEAGGRTREQEREALAASGVPAEVLLDPARGSKGARRPLRVALANAEVDSGLDEHGPYVRTAFDLPRGAYATVVLREIMKPRDGDLEARSDEVIE